MDEGASFLAAFQRDACHAVELIPDGDARFYVVTPFAYDDGDGLSIVLKRDLSGEWLLSDEGHSFMHLGYELDERDVARGPRLAIVKHTFAEFQIQNRNGELCLPLEDNHPGRALFRFIHALVKIDDLRFLSRERTASAFVADFNHFVQSRVEPNRRKEKWSDPKRDPAGLYVADYRINGREKPLYMFALSSTERVNAATITLLEYDRWHIGGDAVGILESADKIAPKIKEKLTNVGARMFSSLPLAEEELGRFYPDVFGIEAQ